MKTVYFVCYGNLCRSPFAERYAALRAPEYGLDDIHYDGAGVGATPGTKCPKPGVTAAAELGVDLAPYRSKHTDDVSPGPDDWILAMDRYVFGALADTLGAPLSQVKGPGGARLELMMQSVAGDGEYRAVGLDVPDPMGSGVAAYRDVYRLLTGVVDRFLIRLRDAR